MKFVSCQDNVGIHKELADLKKEVQLLRRKVDAVVEKSKY